MYSICVRNSEGKRPLREARHKWERDNKMDITETWEGVEGINVYQDCDQWVL